MKPILPLALVALGLCAVRLPAQVPQMIHYQGRIVAGSSNFEGAGLFKFALLGTNGTGAIVSLWSNNGSSVGGAEPSAAVNIPVVKGLYSVLLGDSALPNMQPIPPEVFASPAVYLRVWFSDGATGFQQLAPDQRLSSVGFAMVAGTVPDAAVTPPKLSPGLTGQVLMTDESGRANWAPAAAVVAHAATDDPDAVATADPAQNTCLIKIDGLFTNEVVICGGISVELDTEMQQLSTTYTRVWELPDGGLVSHSSFVFEYAGSATNLLVAQTNAYPRVPRDIHVIVRNALGNEQYRLTLQQMEVARVLPGTAGRLRFVCELSDFNSNLSGEVSYLQSPEEYAVNNSDRTGYNDYFIEIDAQGCYAPLYFSVNPRERTFTLDVGGNEIGSLFKWLRTVSGQQYTSMDIRTFSQIKFEHLPGGGLSERARFNYFEAVPIRYEVLTGFGQFERLRIRVVIKYVLREVA